MSLVLNTSTRKDFFSLRYTMPILCFFSGSIIGTALVSLYDFKNKYLKNKYFQLSYPKNITIEYNILGGLLGLSTGSLYSYLGKPIF